MAKGRMKVTNVLLILISVAATVGRAMECLDQQTVEKEQIMNLQNFLDNTNSALFDNRVCLKPSITPNWKIGFEFGKTVSAGNFQADYKMTLKGRSKNDALYYSFEKGDEMFIDGRLQLKWIDSNNWTCFSLTSGQVTFHFGKELQAVDIHLSGLEITALEMVKITTDLQIIASTNCEKYSERVNPLELSSEAAGYTTSLPTQLSSATQANPIEDYTDISSTQKWNDSKINISDATVALGDSTSDPIEDVVAVPVIEESQSNEDCTRIPFWVWGCVGIMAAFIFFFLVLLIYTIMLSRRHRALIKSSPNKCDFVRGGFTSPGGYGQQVGDLQYFKTENQSVVAIAPHPISAHNAQTVRLPSGNVASPNVQFYTSPRTSIYRRSISCPTSEDQPHIVLPPPPSTPPPIGRPETVPLYCPSGSNDDVIHSYKRGKNTAKRTSSKRQHLRRKEGREADDESSLSD